MIINTIARNTKLVIACMTVAALVSFMSWIAFADTILFPGAGPFQIGGNPSTTNCFCPYTGTARMTNSSGNIWFLAPTNTTTGTVTDTSGFGSPYLSAVKVQRKKDGKVWCATNSVSFPVTNADQFLIMVYIKNTLPPPTTNQIVTTSVQWQ